MKIGVWVLGTIFLLDCLLFLEETECFLHISVSTGMAIIMCLVKIKAVIVKVLLGLKAMGYETLVWRTHRRRRRRRDTQDELLEAWNDLQRTVGKVVEFNEEACLRGMGRGRSGFLRQLMLQEDSQSPHRRETYSEWVSKTIGSLIGNPLGCQILAESLHKDHSHSFIQS